MCVGGRATLRSSGEEGDGGPGVQAHMQRMRRVGSVHLPPRQAHPNISLIQCGNDGANDGDRTHAGGYRR